MILVLDTATHTPIVGLARPDGDCFLVQAQVPRIVCFRDSSVALAFTGPDTGLVSISTCQGTAGIPDSSRGPSRNSRPGYT